MSGPDYGSEATGHSTGSMAAAPVGCIVQPSAPQQAMPLPPSVITSSLSGMWCFSHQTCVSVTGLARRFASIAKMAGEQLQPYVAALIPRLFRYQHDPNGGVREAMTRIWQALVPDER